MGNGKNNGSQVLSNSVQSISCDEKTNITETNETNINFKVIRRELLNMFLKFLWNKDMPQQIFLSYLYVEKTTVNMFYRQNLIVNAVKATTSFKPRI